jgi:hypothetical protein
MVAKRLLKKILLISLAGGIIFSFTNCQGKVNNAGRVCIIDDPAQHQELCKEGDILIFSPSVYGGKQYPLHVIGMLCNLNEPIYFNKGGVICVYTKTRLKAFSEALKRLENYKKSKKNKK